MYLIRIRALYGQIMEKDAVITVLNYRLQQEQEKGDDGDGVSSYTHASSSYNKGKLTVVVIQKILIHT